MRQGVQNAAFSVLLGRKEKKKKKEKEKKALTKHSVL
jgi:hypothetical protein